MGKKSNKTTSKTVYGNTTTTNPYVTSKTTNSGTTSKFNKTNLPPVRKASYTAAIQQDPKQRAGM